MAQGTRVRLVRAAAAGLGVMLCTGLVGCMNWDKPKDTKATKPGQGLPGTPTLPPNGGVAAKGWQPGAGQPYTGPGAGLQQPGFATAGTAGGFQPGRTGINTNTGTGPSQNWGGQPQPGNPGVINSPAIPGVQPAAGVGAPVGAAPHQSNNGVAHAGYTPATPPPPNLDAIPLPPGPPAAPEYAGGSVLPPVPPGPIAPPATPPGAVPANPIRGGF